jgi:pectinesterase
MRIFALPLAAIAALAVVSAGSADGTCEGPNARIEPAAGDIVVDATGDYDGSYLTVSEAVEALDITSTEVQSIFVLPGIYKEQVLIPRMAGALVLQGSTCDAMSYEDNEVTITQATAQKDLPAEVTTGRNDLTSTMRFKASNVKVYNINIANTAGNVGQAVAATIDGTDYGFYGCNFTGYQDTLYANKGRHLYAQSYINGAVDFIFGSTAMAWFESCDIETVGKGCITANGRNSEENPSYYVFNDARVFGGNKAGSSYLVRLGQRSQYKRRPLQGVQQLGRRRGS